MIPRSSLLLPILYASRAAASCAHGTPLMPRAEDGSVPINTFGYTGAIGPLNWAALEAANAQCATGTRQSPIDMVAGVFTTIPGNTLRLSIADAETGAEIENLGTTVEVIAEPGQGTMVFGNTTFELQQFHFHLPSEHLDNGTSHAMEMHTVWSSAAADIAVVGIYIDQGADESPLLASVFSAIDGITAPGTKTRTGPLVMAEIVAAVAGADVQTYSGSLTTPPCSEGVRWLVSTASLKISIESFNKARDVIGFNARFPQNTPGEQNVLQLGRGAAAPLLPVVEPASPPPAQVTESALEAVPTQTQTRFHTRTLTAGRPAVTIPFLNNGGSIVIAGREEKA